MRSSGMGNIAEFSIPFSELLSAGSQSLTNTKTPGRLMKGHFVRGPIPWDWIQRAANLRGRALDVGIALWYMDGFERTGTVKSQPSVIRELGVDRHAEYRALRALEKAGLVSVQRKRGAAPVVTITRLARQGGFPVHLH